MYIQLKKKITLLTLYISLNYFLIIVHYILHFNTLCN